MHAWVNRWWLLEPSYQAMPSSCRDFIISPLLGPGRCRRFLLPLGVLLVYGFRCIYVNNSREAVHSHNLNFTFVVHKESQPRPQEEESIPLEKETNRYYATTSPAEPSVYSNTDFSSSSPGVPSILPPHEEKYLLYFSNNGFANQIICLYFASIYARVLNRTLLLPPVFPWKHEPGSTTKSMFRDKESNVKTTHDHLTEPELHYLQYLPQDRYLPMNQVIDIEFALPDLRTLDVRDFFHRLYYPLNLTKATIEIDYGYSAEIQYGYTISPSWMAPIHEIKPTATSLQRLGPIPNKF